MARARQLIVRCVPLRGDQTACFTAAASLACLGLAAQAQAADPQPEPRVPDATAPTTPPGTPDATAPTTPPAASGALPHAEGATSGTGFVPSAAGPGPQEGAAPNEPIPTVRIHCPALDEEARSALEARMRAEMAADPHAAEQIAVECVDDTAVVTWQVEGQGQRRLRLRPDRTLAVDDLLAAIQALRLGAVESSIARDEVARRPSSGGRSVAFGAIVGAGAQLWHGAVAGALGPRVGLHLSVPHGWSTDLVGAAAWGLTAPSRLHALALEAAWTANYAPIAPLNLGAGADLVALTANLSGPDSTRQTAVTGGLIVRAQGVFHAGPLSMSIGPELEVLARPIVVEVAHAEVFRVPNVLSGLSVDAEGDFIR